jgi:hypothetical protein
METIHIPSRHDYYEKIAYGQEKGLSGMFYFYDVSEIEGIKVISNGLINIALKDILINRKNSRLQCFMLKIDSQRN